MTKTELRVQGIYDSLSNSGKKVADYFLNNVENVFHMPISQLAAESGASQVAWVRFCKTIGFEGLKDLKRSLFTELNENSSEQQPHDSELLYADIRGCDTIDKMIQTVRSSSIQAIDDTLTLLDSDTIERVSQLIIKGDSVKIFGVGASALVAEDLFNKLLRIGKNACFCRDVHIQFTYATNLTPNDVAVFISHSGATQEVIECLHLVKDSGCSTVAITKFCKSVLANEADYLLFTSSPEVYRRSGAMSSRIAQLTLVDVLFTAIANQDYHRVETLLDNSYKICHAHKIIG